MAGSQNGLIVHFRRIVKPRNIIGIHCMAHRLQLAVSHSMDDFHQLRNFEKFINSIHNFYVSHGHKRLHSLKNTIDELNEDFYNLNYIYKVRWIASELNAIIKIKNMWYALVIDLDSISRSNEFDFSTQQKASEIYKQLTDKNFNIILHFFIDVLEVLNHYSIIFQKSGGILIGKSSTKSKMIEALISLKSKSGKNLKKYLDNVMYSRNLENEIEEYERSSVSLKNIELLDKNYFPLLSSFKNMFINTVINEINSLFPDIEVKNFDIFDPQIFPRDPSLFSTYGLNEIKEIHNIFKWNSIFDLTKLLNDWSKLLQDMHSKEDVWCKVIDLDPHKFWARYLNIPDIWTDETLLLIRTVLTIPSILFFILNL